MARPAPSRRVVAAGAVAAALGAGGSARGADASFANAEGGDDPGPFLAFLAAHDGRVVTLDVRLPLRPRLRGVRHELLRGGSVLALIDGRGWWGRGAMLWLGAEGAKREDGFRVRGRFQVSSQRSFEGPGFRSVEGLPWLFTGYHVDPFG